MCITQIKLTTIMKKKKNLYLHLIPHSQNNQMYHTIPKILQVIYFNLKSFMKRMSLETMHGYKFLVSLIIDFDKFQSIPCNCFPHYLTPPFVYSVKMPKHGQGHG